MVVVRKIDALKLSPNGALQHLEVEEVKTNEQRQIKIKIPLKTVARAQTSLSNTVDR